MSSHGPLLSARLRESTQDLHRRAERSGIMPALLDGTLPRGDYVRLLRELHALYAALETALDHHAATPQVAPARVTTWYRRVPLEKDLATLAKADWRSRPLTQSMRDYVARIGELDQRMPPLLVAHAYVRYLGDLSGGQLLRERVRRMLGHPEQGGSGGDAGTAFYTFGIADVGAAKREFRAALDALPVDQATADDIVCEATAAFGRHIELFEELAVLRG